MVSIWQITNQLESHFIAFEARGGDYRVFAQAERSMAMKHSLPHGGSYGDACDGCGQPWPCGVIWGMLAPE